MAAPILAWLLAVVLSSCATPIEREELAREYFNLGNAYYELQDFERSYRYYRRAIELSDAVPAAGFNLARLHLERGEFAAALDVLDRLLESDPTNTLVMETRAYALYRSGDINGARAEYRGLLARSGGRARIAYNLGLLEVDEQEYDRAASVLLENLTYAEEDAGYRWLLAEALFRSGDDAGTLSHLEYYRTLVDGRPALLADLAERYVDWEFYLPALELFEVLPDDVRREPARAWAQARAYLLGGGEFEPGMDALEQALRGGFDDAIALAELMAALREDEQEIIRQVAEEFDIEIPENPMHGSGPPASVSE